MLEEQLCSWHERKIQPVEKNWNGSGCTIHNSYCLLGNDDGNPGKASSRKQEQVQVLQLDE